MKEPSYMLFSGTSHPEFGEEVARSLQVKLGALSVLSFPDGEVGVQILENVRGKDVFVIQSIARRPNHFLVELLILIDALKRASARSIVAVLPYFPYARQDRKDKGRTPITAKLVADLLEKAGVTRVLTMDLHTEQIQGFFNVPVDNLFARPLLVKALKSAGLKNGVVVSPDIGSNRMARKYAEDLGLEIAIVDKRRIDANRVEVNAIIGDVQGKSAVLIDDICSTGGTLETAAKICKEKGAKSVWAVVSHGLMIVEALPKGIDRFFMTNSVHQTSMESHPGVQIVSVAPLFGKAIDCVVQAKSISSLFKRE